MFKKLISHNWGNNKAYNPRIISIVEMKRNGNDSIIHVNQPHWVLDYSYTEVDRCRIHCTDQDWQNRPRNSAILYPPKTSYWEDTPNNKQTLCHSAWLEFEWNAPRDLQRLLHPKYKYAQFSDPKLLVGDIMLNIAQIGQHLGERGFLEANAQLLSIIDHLTHSANVEVAQYEIGTEPEPNIFAFNVEQYLKSNLNEKLTLGVIAQHFHMSPSSLSHRYAKVTNESPIASFIKLKIDHSKYLLQQGWPLKRIADDLGFHDAFHFSKTFKKITGISPKDFRG